jgi:divalent metal cation (Fe/Co/Zn/Cd) transporter
VATSPGVVGVNRIAAVYTGTSHILVELDLDLVEDLETAEIEALLDRLEARVRDVLPDTDRVSVQLNSPAPRRQSENPSA